MSFRVLLAVAVYVCVVLYWFYRYGAAKALTLSVVWGWLFLPIFETKFALIPAFSKWNLIHVTVLFATLLLHTGKYLRFRITKYDIPVCVWCLCAGISSISNGMGLYDAASSMVSRVFVIGLPYFLARIFLVSTAERIYLLRVIVWGGLVYIPLCLFEMRFSPQLHTWIYGFHQHVFAQSTRGFGWRPVVFFEHGLPLAHYLVVCVIIACVATRAGLNLVSSKKLFSGLACVAFALTSILTQSQTAVFILMFVLVWIYLLSAEKNYFFAFFVSLISPYYIYLRLSKLVTGEGIIDLLTRMNVDESRIKSVQYRFNQENLSIDHFLKRVWLGSHSYGDNARPFYGDWKFVYDSNWILAFAVNGLLGTIVNALIYAMPVMIWALRGVRGVSLEDKVFLNASVIVFMSIALNNVLDDVRNPIFYLMLGACSTYWANADKLKKSSQQKELSSQRIESMYG